MPAIETLTIDVKAYVPRLVVAALKVARKPCEYVDVRDCTQHLEERDWCPRCALRRAAAEDLANLNGSVKRKPKPARRRKVAKRRKPRRG